MQTSVVIECGDGTRARLSVRGSWENRPSSQQRLNAYRCSLPRCRNEDANSARKRVNGLEKEKFSGQQIVRVGDAGVKPARAHRYLQPMIAETLP